MSYETETDGHVETGEVFVPERTYNEAKTNVPGMMIYKGDKVSKASKVIGDTMTLWLPMLFKEISFSMMSVLVM